jgi:nicotinate-nucleotide adenylyltransferase
LTSAAVSRVSEPRPLTGAAWAGRRVGLLGGSFNPAHAGHRHIALTALKRLNLHQVWWLVSPQNPLKSVADMAGLDRRLAAARLVSCHPRIIVTALESALGTRFTIDTVTALRRRYTRTRFVWLMGADNLAQIPRWRRWQDIYARLPVAILPRQPYSVASLGGQAARRFSRYRLSPSAARRLPFLPPPAWVFLGGPQHPASATAIRQGVRPPGW